MEKKEDSFLGDVEDNTVDMFAEPEVSKAEGEVESPITEPVGEKIPFNQDPKIKKFIERELNKRLKNLSSSEEKFKQEVVDEFSVKEALDNYAKLIGNDNPEGVKVLQALEKSINQIEARARKAEEAAAFVEQSQAELRQQKEDEEYLKEGFAEIEETYNVDLDDPKIRNPFIDFLIRIAPKDEDGEVREYPDLIEAFDLYQSIKKPASSNAQAKYLASKGLSNSGEKSKTPEMQPTFENVKHLMGIE